MDEKPQGRESDENKLLRRVARWLILLTAVVYGGTFFFGGAIAMLFDGKLYGFALEHFAATIGLPSACLAALCLVTLLEQTSGPIEFEALGFKFKGASGPIVMWVICFLSIAIAIKVLW